MSAALPFYEVHDGTGPYCLLVHGVLAGRAHWMLNLAALQTVCRPVVVELFGHGRSPSPAEARAYHPDSYVEAFEAIREGLGAQRWCVVGHSLGAALTMRYAIARPDRVTAQVFMNSNSALATGEWRERVRAGVERGAAAIERGGRAAIAAHPLHPGRSKRLPADARDALVADAELHDPRGVANTFRHTVPDSPVRDRIAANRVPSMLVVGVREEQFEASRRFVETGMPFLEEVVEVQTGHAVNVQDAPGFNAAATRFLAARGRISGE